MSTTQQNKTIASKLAQRIEELLGIDLRSLGIFRIAIGSLLLLDLALRATALTAHYTDAGVAPRTLVTDFAEQPWVLSLHMLDGGAALQVFLFLITAFGAICLILGFRSRIACVVCWALMLSLHIRNPFVNNLGDWLLVDLLFWGMFLPLGAKFSIDGQLKPTSQKLPVRVVSIATLAILIQICLVYFLSVDRKISPVWHTEGTAIEYALNLDRIVSEKGRLLLALPKSWLQFLTFATLWLERWGPVILFFPLFLGPIRTFVASTFMGFHLILAISFELGVFPFICIAAWVLFLPSWFWDRSASISLVLFGRVSSWMSGLNLGRRFLLERKSQIRVTPGPIDTLVGIVFLFGMISSGMLYSGVMDESYYEKVYKHVEPLINTVNMRQRWDMFSPHPPRKDGWFVVALYAEEGGAIDALSATKKISWERPDQINELYVSQRWRKYYEWVMDKPDPFARSLGKYVTLKFGVESQSTEIAVYFMQEYTREDLRTSTVERIRLF